MFYLYALGVSSIELNDLWRKENSFQSHFGAPIDGYGAQNWEWHTVTVNPWLEIDLYYKSTLLEGKH